MKKLLAILLAIVLTCGTTTLAFAAVTEENYDDLFFDEATEDEAETELISITDFEILTLPDKVFTEPFDGKTNLKILSDEIKQSGHTSYDGPHMQYIKDTSVAYNMKGATAKVYFSDGTSYVYTFGESVYGDFDYEQTAVFYLASIEGHMFQFCVKDIGNYQVEIFIPSEENEIKKTINVQNTSNPDKPDDMNSENSSQNVPENSNTKPINTTKPNDSATKDEVISGTSSAVNSDNNTIATGSGTLLVTILTLTILMSGIVAVYFLKKKRA